MIKLHRFVPFAAALLTALLSTDARAEEGYLGGDAGRNQPGTQQGYLPDMPRNSGEPAARSQPWEQRTLAGPSVAVGFAAGPDLRLGFFSGDPTLSIGGGGTLILGHIIGIGGAGWYSVTRASPPDEYLALGFDRDAASVEIGYGGLLLEGWVLPEYIVHLHLHAMLGGGRASLVDTATGIPIENAASRFFAAEVGANAEMNLTSFLRLRAGIAYRLAAGVEADWLRNRDLFSPVVSLGLRFGWF